MIGVEIRYGTVLATVRSCRIAVAHRWHGTLGIGGCEQHTRPPIFLLNQNNDWK